MINFRQCPTALEQGNGQSKKFTGDVSDIPKHLNGSGAKSCKITGESSWTVYSSKNQGGKPNVLQPGKYDTYGDMGMPDAGAMSAKLGSA